MNNFFTNITLKQAVLAASITLACAGNAMAFSETEFNSALKQLAGTPAVSQEQYAANAVTAWLHQDHINSLAQAEIDASRKNNNQQAAIQFNSMLKKEPDNPLLMSYAGAATAKSSIDYYARGEKTTALEDGIAMVEQALKLASTSQAMHGSVPVALEVRFVAASTFLAIPRIMNHGQQGEQLLNDVLRAEQFAQTDVQFRGAVWIRAASLASEQHRNDDAKKFLTEILNNNAPQSATAAQMLQRLQSLS